jgi:hypothetical protein
MKRLVLALLLLCPSCCNAVVEYPPIIDTYLSCLQLESVDQHKRVEQALLALEGLDKADLDIVMTYLWMLVGDKREDEDEEDDNSCEACCSALLDSLIDEEFGNCGLPPYIMPISGVESCC